MPSANAGAVKQTTGGRPKTDPYAVFLMVATVVLVVGGVFAWQQYQGLQDAEKRQKSAKDWWEQSKKLEAQIHAYPLGPDVGETWAMGEVEEAIIGGDTPRVRDLLKKHNVSGSVAAQYHLNINPQAPQHGDVLASWTFVTLPLEIKSCLVDDLGRFLAAMEILFPQVKATRISFIQQPDKPEGNATVSLTMYLPKEK